MLDGMNNETHSSILNNRGKRKKHRRIIEKIGVKRSQVDKKSGVKKHQFWFDGLLLLQRG